MKSELAIHSQPIEQLLPVLRTSIYPGASDQSIALAFEYCKATRLDVMLKPVHIVPMWDSKQRCMRDVILPGIGLYRITAARSGCAGIGEPEFGPEVTRQLGGVEVTFPLWCKVTVRRLLDNGSIAEFTAKEFWIENYAVKGGQEKSIAPNAMWAKRTFGQLAKCAEAQALRKGFPEVGSLPTAEEMEGKSSDDFHGTTVDGATGEVIGSKKPPPQPELPPYPQEQFDASKGGWKDSIDAGRNTPERIIDRIQTRYSLTDEQRNEINDMKVMVTE